MIEAEEIVLFQIERGADFLMPIAQKFFQDYSFDKFSKSQLHNLHRVIDLSSGFVDMENKVNEWIAKQAKRKKGQTWEEVRKSLPKVLFEWDIHEKHIKDMAMNRLEEIKPVVTDINYLITKDNLMKDLEEVKFRLAKKLFNTLVTLHRCHADEEIHDKIQEFHWGETVED